MENVSAKRWNSCSDGKVSKAGIGTADSSEDISDKHVQLF